MTARKRRQFLLATGTTILGGASGPPLAALAALVPPMALMARAAQAQTATARVTLVLTGTARSHAERVEIIRQRLRELGHVEGRNLILDVREIDGHFERLPKLMEEIVRTNPRVIVVGGSQSVRAAMAATSTIPIVTFTVGAPVAQGFANSLARPGKNVTGNVLIESVSDEKTVEIIHEIVPHARRVAFLDDPANPVAGRAERFAASAAKRGLSPIFVSASSLAELAPAFASAAKQQAQMMIVANTALFSANPKATVALAAHHRIPAIYANDTYVADGGLVTYGYSNAAMARNAAVFVDRILKGRKAAELPFEQPTQFELVLNLKTAKVLGLKIPQSVLIRAERVIE